MKNDQALALAKALISRPSVTPDDGGCQSLISDRLAPLGFRCESMRFNQVDNLWARIGTTAPLFVFAGHTDVVPPGPLSDWSSDPFEPVVRDGYLYGRGASDMKSAIAAMVVAVENFLHTKTPFQGSIGFLLTSDEEGPSIDGTQRVMKALMERGEKIDYCVIGEPSSNQRVGDQIRIGRRGSLHGRLSIHGKQGHVAHPHLAINPIHSAMLALHELAQTTWDQGNEHFPCTTFQISNIHSGTGAANVIPGHLETLFNFRFSTAITPEQMRQRTEALLHKHQLRFDMDWNIGAEPFLTRRGKLMTATQQAIKDITQLEVKLSTGGGTSDGRFIAPTGAEVIELGTSHATAHHINECVQVDDIDNLTTIYQHILALVLSK